MDRATPQLYQALVTNEMITSAKIGLWRPSADGGGTEVVYFTITLTNAVIIDVTLNAHESQDTTSAKGFEYEQIKLTYQKIEWTWNDGGITATENWQTPV